MNYLVPLKCTRIVSAWLSAPKKTPCFIPKWLWFSRVQGNSSLVLFWDQQLFSRSFRISFRITACKMFEVKNQKTPLCVLRYIYIHCFECTCLFALKTNSFMIMSTFILSPFVFYCTNNFCVHIYREIYLPLLFKTLHSNLLHEKERKRTSSFPPIEAKEQSDTCLTYFHYPCKSNAVAPSSWVSEMHRLIYTDVKRGKIFAQLKWF